MTVLRATLIAEDLVDFFESYEFNQSSKYHELSKYHQLCTHKTMRSRCRKSHLRELDMSREFGYLVDSENLESTK